MDWLQFIAALVDSLAWPVSVAIISILFRNQILSLFKRLEELGYGDWKLKLRREIAEAEETAKELPPPPIPTPTDEVDDREKRFSEMVAYSPNGAILDEWLDIEGRLAKMGKRLGLQNHELRHFSRILNALDGNQLFPSSLISLLKEMRNIRNSAAHNPKVSSADAYRFKSLADEVRPFLRADLFDQN